MVLRWSGLTPTTERINQQLRDSALKSLPRSLEELHSELVGLVLTFAAEDERKERQKYAKAAMRVRKIALDLGVSVADWVCLPAQTQAENSALAAK